MTETGQVTRESQIVYITEWASRYRCSLQLNGEVGFGRDCVGVLKGDTYIDTADIKGETAYVSGGEWWEPEDSYHKHDCLAVLGHGDEALGQLYQWVKWLDGHGFGVEEVYREPSSNIDLAFHGISLPKLVRLREVAPGLWTSGPSLVELDAHGGSRPYEVPKPGEPQCEADGVRNGPDGPGGTEHYWTCTAPGTVNVDGTLMCDDHAGERGHGPKQEEFGFDPVTERRPE